MDDFDRLMESIPNDKITEAIQGALGLHGVHQLQQELVEGLRNGEPRGYVALRRLVRGILKSGKANRKRIVWRLR